jgi:hypothetical protein
MRLTDSVGAAGLANNRGGPKMHVHIDMMGVSCFGKLRQCTPLALHARRLLAQMEFGHMYLCFLSDRLISQRAL